MKHPSMWKLLSSKWLGSQNNNQAKSVFGDYYLLSIMYAKAAMELTEFKKRQDILADWELMLPPLVRAIFVAPPFVL